MDGNEPPKRQPVCSICRKPADGAFKPFCSVRCADVDLARWLGGGYAIPGGNVDDDEDGPGAPEVREAETDGA
jgi:uncharacterized protein